MEVAGSSAYSKAMRTLKACDKNNSDSAIFVFYMGKISLDLDKKNLAKKYFKTTLKRDKGYFQAALGLGLLAEQDQKYKEAVGIYEKFLAVEPNNKMILSRIIQILFSMGTYDKIIPYAETLTQIDPSDLNLKVRLGTVSYTHLTLPTKA